MNVLVTGGTGFIGRHMVAALLKKGRAVTLLVRSPGKPDKPGEIDIMSHPNLTLWKGDITRPDTIAGITKNIRVIYHFAAQLGEWGVPHEQFYSVNLSGTRNLLDECIKTTPPRFIFISTPGVQGKGYALAKESLPYNPPYIYEQTKSEAEKLVIDYHGSYGLPMGIFRPDFVYGPGDYRRLALYRAILRKRFFIIGRGTSILHPTYVDDVIQGLLFFGEQQREVNGTFNLAGPEQLTVEDYIRSVARVMGITPPRLKIPLAVAKAAATICEKMATVSRKHPFISHSKIEFLTCDHGSDIKKAGQAGFSPKYGFEEGFKETFSWAKKNNLL